MIRSLIVATSLNQVIGKQGSIPWHMPADLQHFKRTTRGHHVIMGRKTFESLPGTLPGRTLIILSQHHYQAGAHLVTSSLAQALDIAHSKGETEVFIAGGETVYREALALDMVDKIYLTRIHAVLAGDTYFPSFEINKWQQLTIISHSPDDHHPYAYDFIELTKSRDS